MPRRLRDQGAPAGNISRQPFGTADGQPVELFTLRNAKGAEATIMTYGGIVTSLKMPDRNGKFGDVVLGYDTLDGYTSDSYLRGCPYFGALIGRYGNRIGGASSRSKARLTRSRRTTVRTPLHGGLKGFDKVVWKAVKDDVGPQGPAPRADLYVSKDGEEGYPGNLKVTAVYTLTDDNAAAPRIHRHDRQATRRATSRIIPISTSRGQGNGDILGHEVMITADKFTPVDST